MSNYQIILKDDENIFLIDIKNDKEYFFKYGSIGGKILWSIHSDSKQWSSSNVFLDSDVADFLILHFDSINSWFLS